MVIEIKFFYIEGEVWFKIVDFLEVVLICWCKLRFDRFVLMVYEGRCINWVGNFYREGFGIILID